MSKLSTKFNIRKQHKQRVIFNIRIFYNKACSLDKVKFRLFNHFEVNTFQDKNCSLLSLKRKVILCYADTVS